MTKYNVAWCVKLEAENPKEAVAKYMQLLFNGTDAELEEAVGEKVQFLVSETNFPQMLYIDPKYFGAYEADEISFDEFKTHIITPELPPLEDIELYPLL